jgi:hypothetical protein
MILVYDKKVNHFGKKYKKVLLALVLNYKFIKTATMIFLEDYVAVLYTLTRPVCKDKENKLPIFQEIKMPLTGKNLDLLTFH